MAPKQKPNPTRQDKQLGAAKTISLAQAAASVLKHALKYGSRVAIAYFCYLSIDSLAGKETTADLFVRVLTNLASKDSTSEIASYSVAIFCFYLANRWKRQCRDTIEELGKVRAQYETHLDPKRTSSKITKRGETKAEDDR